MRESIRGQLRAFIVREFLQGDGCDFLDSTPLLRTGIVDSLRMVRLLAFMEETFRITLPADFVTAANFSSVECISDLVVTMGECAP